MPSSRRDLVYFTYDKPIDNDKSAPAVARGRLESQGGAIDNHFNQSGIVKVSNSTISGNGAFRGGGLSGSVTIQNSIVAKQRDGGPTQTVPLLSGSPAIDAGNPSGCTDVQGNLLKTDQRGMPRPDPGEAGGCDMSAYESQSN